jgi:hypothetical protein
MSVNSSFLSNLNNLIKTLGGTLSDGSANSNGIYINLI